MSRHWTESYGDVPVEINPDRYDAVVELLEGAMQDFADGIAFHSFGGSTPILAEIVDNTSIETVITGDLGDGLGTEIPGPPVDDRLKGAIRFADALEEGAGLERAPVQISGNDLLFLQYTGGTTGLSKGAACRTYSRRSRCCPRAGAPSPIFRTG